jgi:hypothetical protein
MILIRVVQRWVDAGSQQGVPTCQVMQACVGGGAAGHASLRAAHPSFASQAAAWDSLASFYEACAQVGARNVCRPATRQKPQ